MRRPRHRRLVGRPLLALTLTIGAFSGPAAVATSSAPSAGEATVADGQRTEGITGVRATDDHVTVTGIAPAGTHVDVYALGIEQDESAWTDAEPVATADADQDGGFSARIARAGGASDLYYGKYVAVTDGNVLGTYRHVDDIRVTADNDYPYPRHETKKGLQVQMSSDAEQLGIGHAGINVAFDDLMQLENEGAGSIPFTSNGEKYYFDAGTVAGLDRQIKPLSDDGVVVNLILILYRDGRENSAWPVLKHPGADLDGGPVFGFDTETAEGVAHFTAAVEFLAQRYTREDGRHGRATGFIVGNEIDAQWVWQNMGEKPLDEFLVAYERALRITHLATRAAYSGARTYTSLTHSWRTPSGPAEPAGRYYPGKDVVDGLNTLTKEHGDYPWHVAHHPYPEDLHDPAFWEDTSATPDPESTPRITFKNIEVLNEYLLREGQRYEGRPRRVILSEQGCNTPGTSAEAERLQAACYALAYYKVHFLEAIDSFILHRHVDHKNEGGLRLGLWWWDDELPGAAPPGEPKLIHDVFAAIDTDRSLEVTEFAKDVIGIDDWSEVVDGWDPGALAVRDLPAGLGASNTAKPRETSTVSDFSAGAQGWRPSDGANAVEAVDGRLRTRFTSGAGLSAQLWRGTEVGFDEPLDASAHTALGLRIRIPAGADIGSRHGKVKLHAADGSTAESTVRLVDDGSWQQVVVDLESWTARSAIERIKVWARGDRNAAWSGHFDIDDVRLAAAHTGADRAGNVGIDVAAPEGVTPGAPVEITVTNDDVRPLSEPLAVKTCAGLELTPATLPTTGIAPGDNRTFTAAVTDSETADPYEPTVCFKIVGRAYAENVDTPPPEATPIFDFDDGTVQGWQAGSGVDSVQAVTSTANAPGSPQSGSHALDATAAVGSSLAPKTMFVDLAEPLDLTAASTVVAHVNSYGGAPGATGYEATFTLASGTDEVTVTQPYSPDSWNEVALDVSGWAGRSAVDRVEVTMHAVGTDYPAWNPHLQVDSLGWFP